MASSNSKTDPKLLCRIRKEPVAALPEERVRQRILSKMIDELGFPPSHISLEVPLKRMPHLQLQGREIPDRRADIVVFASGIHPKWDLYPLLLVECKAVPITEKTRRQAAGYNHYIGACFVCLVNDEQLFTGRYDPREKEYQFLSFLPHYQRLVDLLKS